MLTPKETELLVKAFIAFKLAWNATAGADTDRFARDAIAALDEFSESRDPRIA